MIFSCIFDNIPVGKKLLSTVIHNLMILGLGLPVYHLNLCFISNWSVESLMLYMLQALQPNVMLLMTSNY